MKKIREHHITNNQEFRSWKSDRDRVTLLCKDPNCRYELRAKPTRCGDAWVITKQDRPHTCMTEHTRDDHECLTASLIADVIENSDTSHI